MRTFLILTLLGGGAVAQACGDCNRDAMVTIVDGLRAAQVSAGLIVPTPEDLCVCDVADDGSITILDGLRIAQAIVGLPVPLLCSACGGGGCVWSAAYGSTGDEVTTSVAVCPCNMVVQTGYYTGACSFGGSVLPCAGGEDAFLAKYSSGGWHVFSLGFGDASDQRGTDVVVDHGFRPIVIGQFAGSIDLGGGPLVSAGGTDVFLGQVTASGYHLWSHRFGDGADQAGGAVAVDAAGSVVIAGGFQGSIDFGGGPLTSAGGEDVYLAKFTNGGAHVWSQAFGAAGSQVASELAVSGAGEILLTGAFQGTLDLGGTPLQSAGGDDLFVARFDASGNHLWSAGFGDAADQAGTAIAVDSAGAAVVTGTFAGSIDLGGGPLFSAGLEDVLLAKLDAGGNHVWSVRFGDGGTQVSAAVTVDSGDNVVVCGAYGGTVDFGGPTHQSSGSWDVFVAKLDDWAGFTWSRSWGDVQEDRALGVAINQYDDVFVGGTFRGTIDIGQGPHPSAGGQDAFLTRLEE
jgi:hypothetical protein